MNLLLLAVAVVGVASADAGYNYAAPAHVGATSMAAPVRSYAAPAAAVHHHAGVSVPASFYSSSESVPAPVRSYVSPAPVVSHAAPVHYHVAASAPAQVVHHNAAPAPAPVVHHAPTNAPAPSFVSAESAPASVPARSYVPPAPVVARPAPVQAHIAAPVPSASAHHHVAASALEQSVAVPAASFQAAESSDYGFEADASVPAASHAGYEYKVVRRLVHKHRA